MPRRSPPTLFEASPPQQQSTGGKTNYATYSAPVLKTKYPMLVMTIPTLMGLTKLQPHQEMLRRRLLVPYNAAMRGRIMFISHQVRTPSLPSGIDLSARHREAYGHATHTPAALTTRSLSLRPAPNSTPSAVDLPRTRGQHGRAAEDTTERRRAADARGD